jgi:hypothetical protein
MEQQKHGYRIDRHHISDLVYLERFLIQNKVEDYFFVDFQFTSKTLFTKHVSLIMKNF